MKSPFPGMDPYLEEHWGDVHTGLIAYARDQLQPRLPSGLRARAQERVFLESPQGAGRPIYPDVRVVEHEGRGSAVAVLDSAVAVAEPIIVYEDEPMTQRYLEIAETGGEHRVVTVIEFLSPANKSPGDGRKLYLKKQRELKQQGITLVEVDLVRKGKRATNARLELIPRKHRTPYHACVLRGWESLKYEIYPMPLRQRLPAIRVPLRQTDKDVVLELQPLIDQCYRNGRYDDIDYTVPPEPPLKGDDAEWADALLREKGLRK